MVPWPPTLSQLCGWIVFWISLISTSSIVPLGFSLVTTGTPGELLGPVRPLHGLALAHALPILERVHALVS